MTSDQITCTTCGGDGGERECPTCYSILDGCEECGKADPMATAAETRCGMKFELTESQVAEVTAWMAERKIPYVGAIGGEVTFTFTPTSLGVVAKVRHISGAELDLSEYGLW